LGAPASWNRIAWPNCESSTRPSKASLIGRRQSKRQGEVQHRVPWRATLRLRLSPRVRQTVKRLFAVRW
jgi:hypothetical protein